MIEKTMYIADDGRAFENEDECFKYEMQINYSDILQSVIMFTEEGKVILFENDLYSFNDALDNATFILIPSCLENSRISAFSNEIMNDYYGKFFPTATGLYRWDYNRDEWVSFKAETHRLIEMWEPMLNIKITSERH